MTMGELSGDTFKSPSFSLRNRIMRAAWNVFWVFFFRFSPRPLHRWRRMVLRLWGARVGEGAHIYPSVRIWAPWMLECGEEVGVGDDVTIYNQGRITIGRRSVISQGSYLCAGTHDYTRRGMPLITKPIVIGSEVWRTAQCFVLPGVLIGNGVVVGARSVVSRDMPAWHVCAGNPCVAIKKRLLVD